MVDKKQIFNWMDTNKDDLYNILADIVKIKTINQGDPDTCDESECSKYMADLYNKMGLDVSTYAFDKDKVRANVVGRVPGSGGGKSLIFNGHMDVVPVTDIQFWEHEPFGAEIKDGFMYGRGAADCKAGIAAMTYAVQALKAAGVKLKGDVFLIPSVGEESCEGGDKGLGPTAKALLERDDIQKPSAVVICEQTNMTIQVEDPNLLFFEVVVEGKAAHVSARNKCIFPQRNYIPQGNVIGVDAIEKLMTIIEMFYRKERDWNLNWFTSEALGVDDILGVGNFSLTPVDLSGGTYLGSMPATAKVTYCLWYPMNIKREDMMKEIRDSVAHIAENDIWLREHPPVVNMPVLQDWPGFSTNKNSPFIDGLKESYKEVTGKDVIVCGFAAACDATWTDQLGLESIVHGSGGNGSNCHGANENMDLAELLESAKVYANIMMNLCEIDE